MSNDASSAAARPAASGVASRSGPAPSARRRWAAPVALAALVAVAIGCTLAQAPAAPLGAEASADQFSAARAMEHIEAISQETRPIGSAAHAETREYLIDQLEELGWEVEVQEHLGLGRQSTSRTQRLAFVQNIVATRAGSDPTGTLMLAAHYDSVDGSPGAGDDGIGIGSILESARAIQDEDPRNDLVVLITDGEESGLLGAEAFTRDDAASMAQPIVVVNLEARGTAGSPLTFRTSSPNAPITAYTSAAGGVVANSAMETVFGLLSNDTDFSRFSEGGLLGVDSAIVGGGALYHSPLDSPENLSPASLQQMGQTTLALTRELQNADLALLEEGEDTVVATVPWGLLRFPLALELPFAITGLLAAVASVVLARRRRLLTLPRTLAGIVVALASIGLAAAGAVAIWSIARAIDPGQASVSVGDAYVSWPYLAAIIALTAGATVGVFLLLRRTLGAAALATGALLAVTAIGLALAVALPGAASVVAFPGFFAALGVLASLLVRGPWRVVAIGTGLLPAFALITPLAGSAGELGLPMGGPVAGLFLGFVGLLMLPLVALTRSADAAARSVHADGGTADAAAPGLRETNAEGAASRQPARPLRAALGAASVLVVVALLVSIGLAANREGATLPRQEHMEYALDTDSGTAVWSSYRAPVSEWGTSMLAGGAGPASAAGRIDAPWWGNSVRHWGEAPAMDFDAPAVTLVADELRDGRRHVTLRVSSQRGAPALGVWIAGSVSSARVGELELPVAPVGERWDFGVQAEGVGDDGYELTVVVSGDVEVLVADRSPELSAVDGFEGPQGRALVQQGVWVSRVTVL